jgi:exodeoxyribonuclease-5
VTVAAGTRLALEARLFDEYGLNLTDTQRDIISELLEWCLQPGDGQQAVLSGYAGTGKTTILQVLVLELIHTSPNEGDWIWITTPTHKAAKVLYSKLIQWQALVTSPIPCACTIHSALSLKPKRALPHEPESFDQSGRMRIGKGDLIIVDECSMIGSELYRIITEAAEKYSCRVLFTGDPKQLQPVNERRISKSFECSYRYELTNVLRHDGAILSLASSVRAMPKGGLPRVKCVNGGATRVVAHLNMADLVDAWIRQLHTSPENVVFLCWTNKVRRQLNKTARHVLFGDDVPDFMEGDNLVMLKAYERNGQVILSNNQDICVKHAELVEHKPLPDCAYTYSCWKLDILNMDPIYVLSDASVKRFKSDLDKLYKSIKPAHDSAKAQYDFACRQAKKHNLKISGNSMVAEAQDAVYQVKKRWATEYFALKNSFAEVDFNYAVTIHKSQGSTYPNVFVHNDYLNSKDERLKLLYVAITRASQEVHHLEM